MLLYVLRFKTIVFYTRLLANLSVLVGISQSDRPNLALVTAG